MEKTKEYFKEDLMIKIANLVVENKSPEEVSKMLKISKKESIRYFNKINEISTQKQEKQETKSELSNQQKDLLFALISTSIVWGLMYHYFFKSFLVDLLGFSNSTALIITILAWIGTSGGLIGKLTQHAAYEKIAYGK